jgi:hypothetical protein
MRRRATFKALVWFLAYSLVGVGLWRAATLEFGPSGPYHVSHVEFRAEPSGEVRVQGSVTNIGPGAGEPVCYVELYDAGFTVFDGSFGAIAPLDPHDPASFDVRTSPSLGERLPTHASVSCHQPH